MEHTPLKFIKFEIGTLCIRVLNAYNARCHFSIKDVKIDLEIQTETLSTTGGKLAFYVVFMNNFFRFVAASPG